MRIIIVEDEIKIRTGMAKLISSHTEHEVIGEAKNGKDGLELILHLRPDLVISDIRMPVMGGLEMLEELNKAKVKCHCIILSGFSEFEYAQKAIRYGVDDYLLKPLAAEDVMNTLESMQNKINLEEQERAETTEGILRSILLGGQDVLNNEQERLKKSGIFAEEGCKESTYLLAGYIGNTSARYNAALTKVWEKMRACYLNYNFIDIVLDNLKQMFVLINADISEAELVAKLRRRLFMELEEDDQPAWAFSPVRGLESLVDTRNQLLNWQLYGIRTGYHVILTREIISQIDHTEYEYPKQYEQRMRTAICSGKSELITEESEDFKEYVRSAHWNPREYGRTYKRLLQFMENTFQDVSGGAEKALGGLEIEHFLRDAKTLGELEYCLDRLTDVIIQAGDTKEDIRNYVIMRAIRYIKDHYQEELSLEFLADYLNLTPEYLSTLFNREAGMNFTSFLKEFRISNAKRLLKSTDMKIYEVAQAVGYRDPKYFNRVFKEETGESPGDFRQ